MNLTNGDQCVESPNPSLPPAGLSVSSHSADFCQPCIVKLRQLGFVGYSSCSAINQSLLSKNEALFCSHCGAAFLSVSSIRRHLKFHKKKFSCDECSRSFTNEASLRRHGNWHRNECNVCHKHFSTNDLLQTHNLKFHHAAGYKCEDCGKKYPTMISLVTHMRIHSGENLLTCNLCDKSFDFRSNLTAHKMSHMRSVPGRKFRDRYALRKHEILHDISRWSFKCKYCDKAFPHKEALARHVSNHTGEKPFECEVCSKRFFVKNELKSHMYVHLDKNKFKCKLCDCCFKRPSRLRLHMRHHTGQLYHCVHCDKGFVTKSGLSCHMSTHTKEKPYICDVCEERYAGYHNFKMHYARRHSSVEDRIHECSHCGKRFANTTALKVHMIIHGDRKHVCTVCGRRFYTATMLRSHAARVHVEAKLRYMCTVCGKRFKFVRLLVVHVEVDHKDLNNFRCELCGEVMTSVIALASHVRSHNPKRGRRVRKTSDENVIE